MRPVDEMVNQICDPKFGIIFNNGEQWKIQRKSFVRLMKRTGFQTSRLKLVIDHVWLKMKDALTKNFSMVVGVNEPMKFSNNGALEVVEMCLMELLTLTFVDPMLFPGRNVPTNYLKNFNAFRTCGVQWIDANASWYRYPILKYLAPHLSGFVWIKDTTVNTEKNMNEIVSLHKKARQGRRREKRHTETTPHMPLSKVKSGISYIDSYLDDIDQIEGAEAKHRLHKALIASLKDIFLGADGIVMGFYSLLYCLSRNPHIQNEMRKEMKQGTENLPYCRAVILETQRYIPQGGIGPQHYSEEDVLVDGFRIPAGTDVYPNVMGIFQSKEHWDQPEVFNPMRFLGQDGQLLHPKTWLPFSIGERTCPGKSFSLEVLLMLGMKIVTELDLSFVDFVDKEVNELKYYGMSLVHLNPFKIVVKELESHTTAARADLVTDTSLVGQHADVLSQTTVAKADHGTCTSLGGQHVDVLSSTSASWPTKQTATLATRKKQETELLQNAAKFSYLEGKVEKQLDCIIIGAGISGLDAAYHIKVGFM